MNSTVGSSTTSGIYKRRTFLKSNLPSSIIINVDVRKEINSEKIRKLNEELNEKYFSKFKL